MYILVCWCVCVYVCLGVYARVRACVGVRVPEVKLLHECYVLERCSKKG